MENKYLISGDDSGLTATKNLENDSIEIKLTPLIRSWNNETEMVDVEIEIDGTKGSLKWRQENPNELIFRQNGKPHQIYTRDPNAPFTNELGAGACRLPAGHPEAFFEAFANVYTAAFDDMAKRASGENFERRDTLYPNIYDGVEGMYFIQQCVASSQENAAWLPLKHEVARR